MQARAHTDYRHALAQFATGVTIVTTRTEDGTPTELTVTEEPLPRAFRKPWR